MPGEKEALMDPVETTETTEATGAKEGGGETAAATEAKQKLVPISELLETRDKLKEARKQITAYEESKKADELKNMSEVERLKVENADLKGTVTSLKTDSLKSAAFLKAKGAIGAQYELPAEAEAKLVEKIAKPSFDVDDIADLVEMAKKPRNAAKSVLTTSDDTNKPSKPAKDYTQRELAGLFHSDKAKYDRIMGERRKK